MEGAGMAGMPLGLELLAVAFRAACRAHERGRIGEGRVFVAERACLLEGRLRLRQRPLLQVRPAQEPGGLGVGASCEDRPQLVAGLGGPTRAEQGTGQLLPGHRRGPRRGAGRDRPREAREPGDRIPRPPPGRS